MAEKQIVTRKKKIDMEEMVECLKNWRTDVIERTIKVARVYVDFIEQDRNNFELIKAKTKGFLSAWTFSMLEGVGRGNVDPRCFEMRKHRKYITRLPKSLQERIYDGERFPYHTADGTHLKLRIRDCETKQAKQVFARHGIRDIAEQKVWMQTEEFESIRAAKHESGIIYKKNSVVVNGPMEITNEEWIRIGLQ